jgi:hypothetical protein
LTSQAEREQTTPILFVTLSRPVHFFAGDKLRRCKRGLTLAEIGLTIFVDGFNVVGGVKGVKLVAGGRANGKRAEMGK